MPTEKKFQFTQSAFDKLQKELAYMEGEERQHIIEQIATARAHGDLSENAEYHAARERQGQQEAKIREIRTKLENAEIIADDDEPVAKPGKLVTLRFDGDDEVETYLVGEREEDAGEYSLLTPESPVGAAISGRGPGEKVTAKMKNGSALTLQIVDVRNP